ncbi:hypothetical protein MMC28_007800 [Mycoblastus sanguinarius]|nr:hypothetical protein [Mycoblastus sanguinarius]
MPPVDWSNVNGKDEVYRPDSEKMCGTLLDQILQNPFEEVPSNYNTFILHVLEAHRQLQVDKNDLQSELEAERECHSSDVDEFHRIIKSLSEGGWPYGLNILRTNTADSLRQQGVHTHTNQQDYVDCPTSSSQSSDVLSIVDTKENELQEDGCYKRTDSTPRTLKHPRLLAPSRRTSTLISLTTATETNNEPAVIETVLSPMEEYRASESSSDNFSSGEDFNTDTVLRLTRWLALRVGCQEKDIFPELQELLRYRGAEESGEIRSNLRQAAPNMPTNSADAVSPKPSDAPGAQTSDVSINQGSRLSDSGRRRAHHRGFSFLPGDDSTDPAPSELPPNEGRGSRFRINIAAREKGGDQSQF